ncbi:mitochondrial import inner membrane translocase subunit Tim10 B [Diorhabda sublineata]|uniref:mitochondrial import inner membrane translocase subunit Tim10 B n=1 Tax=Diorhabda sublineata TaxID=1163346 RepID=UPI0024E09FA5|nr:mitochondrial import inner membrane translocase subunit Tim10 B [Diorhabda sublineata]
MEEAALRNFKDFLLLYNKMTEMCFKRCVDNVNSRTLDGQEAECIEDCSSKFIKYNNRLMQNFVHVQTELVNKRVAEVEKQQSNLEAS